MGIATCGATRSMRPSAAGLGQLGSRAASAKYRARSAHLSAPLKNLGHREVEGGSSSGVYFRTSLYDYQKVRAQVHYQPLPSLSISADFTLLNNQNPLAGSNYDYSSHQESLSLYWAPRASKIFDFQGSYSRSDLKSNIGYLDPGICRSKCPVIATTRIRPRLSLT